MISGYFIVFLVDVCFLRWSLACISFISFIAIEDKREREREREAALYNFMEL